MTMRIGAALAPYLLGGRDGLARKVARACHEPTRNKNWGPRVLLQKDEAERILTVARSLRAKGVRGGVSGKELSAAGKAIGEIKEALHMKTQNRIRRTPRGGKKTARQTPSARLSAQITRAAAKRHAEDAQSDVNPDTLRALAQLVGESAPERLSELAESVTLAEAAPPGEPIVNTPANDLAPSPPPAEAPQVEHVAHHFQSGLLRQIADLEVIYQDWTERCRTMRDAIDKLRELAKA